MHNLIRCTDNGKRNQYQPKDNIHEQFKKDDIAKLVITC